MTILIVCARTPPGGRHSYRGAGAARLSLPRPRRPACSEALSLSPPAAAWPPPNQPEGPPLGGRWESLPTALPGYRRAGGPKFPGGVLQGRWPTDRAVYLVRDKALLEAVKAGLWSEKWARSTLFSTQRRVRFTAPQTRSPPFPPRLAWGFSLPVARGSARAP